MTAALMASSRKTNLGSIFSTFFITTSTFSKDATEYAEGVETKVILIDGARLTELMFDYGVGVSTVNSYVVKRIDSDFFEDEIVPEAASETETK